MTPMRLYMKECDPRNYLITSLSLSLSLSELYRQRQCAMLRAQVESIEESRTFFCLFCLWDKDKKSFENTRPCLSLQEKIVPLQEQM